MYYAVHDHSCAVLYGRVPYREEDMAIVEFEYDDIMANKLTATLEETLSERFEFSRVPVVGELIAVRGNVFTVKRVTHVHHYDDNTDAVLYIDL